MNKKHIITTVVVAVVIGVVGFFGGSKYGQAKAKSAAPTFTRTFNGAGTGANFAGRTGAGRAGANGGLVAGEVIKQDETSLTVQLPNNGGSKIVLFSGSTTVGKVATGTTADLVTGTNVVVTGSANSDGSVTAQNIQIRPSGMPGMTPQ